jgi:hypothetical protein
MGRLYRSAHEFVFVFKNGTAPHINNVELRRFGRNRTNIWQYPGASALGGNRVETLELHPTIKPLALVADAILDCSKRGGIILDAFAGSGTTLLAAEKTGRVDAGIELDPLYVDVIAPLAAPTICGVRTWADAEEARHRRQRAAGVHVRSARNAPRAPQLPFHRRAHVFHRHSLERAGTKLRRCDNDVINRSTTAKKTNNAVVVGYVGDDRLGADFISGSLKFVSIARRNHNVRTSRLCHLRRG